MTFSPRPRVCAVLALLLWNCGDSKPHDIGVTADGGDGHNPSIPQQCQGKYAPITAGQPCGCTSDCNQPELCVDEANSGIPFGICLRPCGSGRSCPAGMACTGLDVSAGCWPVCTQSSDCPPGRVCKRPSAGDPLVCLPHCQNDNDCPMLGSCDRYTGACGNFGIHPGPGVIGAPCSTGQDCISGDCFPDLHRGGMCRASCSAIKNGCPAGSQCIRIYDDEDSGWCMPTCSGHGDCRDGYSCQNLGLYFGPGTTRMVCAPSEGTCRGATNLQSVMGPCGCDQDCNSGEVCFSESTTGRPGGRCVRFCDESTPCPAGTECTSDGLCAQLCSSPADCAPTRTCGPARVGDSVNHCIPQCQRDADCVELKSCDRFTGSCGKFGTHPGSAAIGQKCTADADCVSDFCVRGTQFPQGYCTAYCSLIRQGCPAGSSCSMPVSATQGSDLGVCLSSCETSEDCRVGYLCEVGERAPDYSACFPE